MRLKTIASVHDVSATVWNRLANPATFNPTVSHAFFSALEDSGCATAKTGWAAQHMVLEDDDGQIAGLAPCYLKSHSLGEYVFDHGWAEAFARAGGRYYPKLQSAVPFTPVPGPRLFAVTAAHRQQLAEGQLALCRQLGASSAHITFLPQADWEMLQGVDWLARQDIQFHWHNANYQSFEDFLTNLSSAKRKNIRKERKAVQAAGITFDWITGAALTEAHWDQFFEFYLETGARKWGRPYLNRDFFSRIGEALRTSILLVFARRAGQTIAGALNFIGSDTLYGRNWGATEHYPFLHFETCYYQAIEFAIAHNLRCVEAGAQGEHKLARGYLPVKTYSLHHFAHQGLGDAVARYLAQERIAIDNAQQELAEHSPFRQEQD